MDMFLISAPLTPALSSRSGDRRYDKGGLHLLPHIEERVKVRGINSLTPDFTIFTQYLWTAVCNQLVSAPLAHPAKINPWVETEAAG